MDTPTNQNENVQEWHKAFRASFCEKPMQQAANLASHCFADKIEDKAFRLACIGCSDVPHIDRIRELGAVTFVESTEEKAAAVRAACPNSEVVASNMCSLPFDDQFDLVISCDAFHDVVEQLALLRSVAKSLRPSGLLVVEMGAAGNIAQLEQAFTCAMRQHSGDYSCQFVFPKEKPYQTLLKIAGFEVLSMETHECAIPLPGGERGLRMFARAYFPKVFALYRPQDAEKILDSFEQSAQNALWDDKGAHWIADCKRLQFTARLNNKSGGASGASALAALGM